MSSAFWLILVIAHLPLLVVHFNWMLNQEAYHYLPALALSLCLLFMSRWDRVMRLPANYATWAVLLLATCVLMPLASWVYSPWLVALSFVICTGAFLYTQGGKDENADRFGLLRLWPLTWLVLPPPMDIDQQLTATLQLRSSSLSSYLLDLLEVPHTLFGNVLELPSGKLFVEEACSGVQSLYTLIFCSILIVVGLRRPMSLLPIYIVFAGLWAGLLNVMRIVTIAVVKHWYQLDWSQGWQHSAIGYAALSIAAVLLLSTDRALRVLFFPTGPEPDVRANANPIAAVWNYLFWPTPSPPRDRPNRSARHSLGLATVVASLAVVLFSWQSVEAVSRMAAQKPKTGLPLQPFILSPESIPPSEVEGFVQSSHEHVRGKIEMPMGEYADIWRGTVAGLPVAIALNQPYPELHDLAYCYRGVGWQLKERQNVDSASPQARGWGYTFSRWNSDRGAHAYVWYCAFDESGRYVESDNRSLFSRLRYPDSESLAHDGTAVAMVQMVLESDTRLSPEMLARMEGVFVSGRQFLLSKRLPYRQP